MKTIHRVKLAHVIPSMNIGGREQVVLDIINHLDRNRFDTQVVCIGRRGSLYDQFAETGVPLHFLNKEPGFKPKIYFTLQKHFNNIGYDVIHSHNPGALIYCAFGAKLAGMTVIINSEHGYGHKITWRKEIIESLLRNWITVTLAVSDDLKNRLSRRGLVRDGKIKRLYNGIDVQKYMTIHNRFKTRKEFNLDNGDILIGTVGRLAAVKDQKTLIRSYKLLLKSIKSIRLIIVGSGEKRDTLVTFAQDHGVSSRQVIFAGERKDIPELLSAMDVFVLPSLSEGISITLLEAMASGKPIVATAVGGNCEIIEDGRSGLLIPPKKPHILSDSILKLIKNPALSRSLGLAAQRRVQSNFCLKNMIMELEKYYISLVKNGQK